MSRDDFMGEAIRLAVRGVRRGDGGPFGAVVVKDGVIIGRGWNTVTSRNDPTAHAEIVAIRRACRRLGSFRLDGCVLYASCEPCPMCLAAIYWARIKRVYFAATRDDAAGAGFDDARFYKEIARPAGKRRLQTRRVAHPEARSAFRAWQGRAEKVSY